MQFRSNSIRLHSRPHSQSNLSRYFLPEKIGPRKSSKFSTEIISNRKFKGGVSSIFPAGSTSGPLNVVEAIKLKFCWTLSKVPRFTRDEKTRWTWSCNQKKDSMEFGSCRSELERCCSGTAYYESRRNKDNVTKADSRLCFASQPDWNYIGWFIVDFIW